MDGQRKAEGEEGSKRGRDGKGGEARMLKLKFSIDTGIATAADAGTGKVHWQKRIGGTFYASPICIDDAIYNIDVAGNVTVLRASKEFEVLGRCSLGDGCHSTPAVAHDRLYLRTFHGLSALDRRP